MGECAEQFRCPISGKLKGVELTSQIEADSGELLLQHTASSENVLLLRGGIHIQCVEGAQL